MSTLKYLDNDGRVSYNYVEWKMLNDWLSSVNSDGQIGQEPPKGVNRGKIIEELEYRKSKSTQGVGELLVKGLARIDRGYSRDWSNCENDSGYTHLEELLIYQPDQWRTQVREYVYKFHFDVNRQSSNPIRCMTWTCKIEKTENTIPIYMWSSILVVLFHPVMQRSTRYEPINFLLAYGAGASNPLESVDKYITYFMNNSMGGSEDFIESMEKDLMTAMKNLDGYNEKTTEMSQLSIVLVEKMRLELSPLDYLFHFQEKVQTYDIDILDTIGKQNGIPRLWLMKELDFSLIIGQRAAKHIIREEVVTYFWNRSKRKDEMCSNFSEPLSMIFAGPSGNGKTELAIWLSKLLNKPEEDAFHKVDCGSLTDGRELFGMSGAFFGSTEGSALNNFICRITSEPESIGVVLLDEIEKAERSVIHGLYQILDKGEWTNKRLEEGRAQTEVISCRNIIFIMTTNTADCIISNYATKHQDMYTANMDELEYTMDELSLKVQKKLQATHPFTDAFVGRIGKVIPFLPMGNDERNHHDDPLLREMKTVAKLLIEREEETITGGRKDICMNCNISTEVKEKMAEIIVKLTPPGSGVRGIQKLAKEKVCKKLMHKGALEKRKGGIGNGSVLTFSADTQKNRISFRENINNSGSFDIKEQEESLQNLSLQDNE